MNSPAIYIEISQATLKLLKNGEGLETPLERGSNGRLTAEGREKLSSALRGFLKRRAWQPKMRTYCAIGANGVSIRRLSLPATSTEEDFQRVLMLQVEAEFPLSPDELAWGWRSLGENRSDGTPAKKEVLVVAVKKDVIEDYRAVFTACDLNPVFTLGALARAALCPAAASSFAMLDVGRKTSELTLFENGSPRAVRILPWGQDDFFGTGTGLDSVSQNVSAAVAGGTVFITGGAALHQDFPAQLGTRLGNGAQCRRLETMPGEGRSATTLGLKQFMESASGGSPLILRTKPRETAGLRIWSQPAARKLVFAGVALLLGLLLLPFAEALVLKPFLTKKLAGLKSDRSRLPMIDRELDFLQYLKQSQPPALDVLYVFAKSAPPGARIESVTMDRHGEIAVRGSMQNGDQVADFRSKLIASGCFTEVSVEEQTPTPDRQKVNVRLAAKSKPAVELATLPIGPTAEEIEKAKSPPNNAPGGVTPGMGFPGGMPAGTMPAGFPAGAMPTGLPPGVVLPPGAMRGGPMPPGAMPQGGMPMIEVDDSD